MRRQLLLLLMFAPSLALANGGPVGWTGPTGSGGITPLDNSRIALLSEKLTIRFEDDGAHYHVLAAYVLANPGPKASVKYGVPLFWYPPDMGEVDLEDITQRTLVDGKVSTYPKDVLISIAGQRFPCGLKDVRPVKDKYAGHVKGWCVAELEIPQGDNVPLTLEYTGSFEFIDSEYSKSPFTEYSRRSLHYDLSPAGHWSGRPKLLEIVIDTGIWRDLFHPLKRSDQFTKDGSRFVLHATDVDLKAFGSVDGTLDAAPVLKHRQRVSMKPDDRFSASASSELAPQQGSAYAAANVLDGNPTTAWCASKAGGAVGQWIEIHAKMLSEPCALSGYVLVPGYAKNQQSWTRNNRIRAVRLGLCGKPEDRKPVRIDLRGRFDTSAVEFEPIDDEPIRYGVGLIKDYCLRLTIIEVEPGEAGDTCISEFRPVLNCG